MAIGYYEVTIHYSTVGIAPQTSRSDVDLIQITRLSYAVCCPVDPDDTLMRVVSCGHCYASYYSFHYLVSVVSDIRPALF